MNLCVSQRSTGGTNSNEAPSVLCKNALFNFGPIGLVLKQTSFIVDELISVGYTE